MLYGSELVKTYFPDAPERCLSCPGLITAAGKLDTWANVSSANVDIALERGAMEDEAAAVIADVIGTALTQESTRLERELTPIAKGLYENCEDGPDDQHSFEDVVVRGAMFKGLVSGRVTTRADSYFVACRSTHPVAAFIGADHSYRSVISKPVEK